MKMFINKYRIVSDDWLGYEVQKWRWWFPFWYQIGHQGKTTNTSSTYDEAAKILESCERGRVVYTEDDK